MSKCIRFYSLHFVNKFKHYKHRTKYTNYFVTQFAKYCYFIHFICNVDGNEIPGN